MQRRLVFMLWKLTTAVESPSVHGPTLWERSRSKRKPSSHVPLGQAYGSPQAHPLISQWVPMGRSFFTELRPHSCQKICSFCKPKSQTQALDLTLCLEIIRLIFKWTCHETKTSTVLWNNERKLTSSKCSIHLSALKSKHSVIF